MEGGRKDKASVSRTGGSYVPPAKRFKLEKSDIGSDAHQREQWEANKRKINGLINRANISNIGAIVRELYKCNLIRNKGLFVASLIKAQETSPEFTDVYAALASIVNARIKTIGILLVNRLILQYRSCHNKSKSLAQVKFMAHLVNQEVAGDSLAYELIEDLIRKPDAAQVEILIALLRECGAKLEQIDRAALFEVFKKLRDLSLDNDLDSRTHDLIDLIHNIRRDHFKGYPPIRKDLDLIEAEDRITHDIRLHGPVKEDFHMELNYFKFDPKWIENESKYSEFLKKVFEQDECDSSGTLKTTDDQLNYDTEKCESSSNRAASDNDKNSGPKIVDATSNDIISFRKMVYLTFRSSVRHDEVVHKLLKKKLSPELIDELCQMIVDCCGQERTYVSIYGLVASKLCQISKRSYASNFETIFSLFYETVYKFETNRIRNIARFYGHLLATESIDWSCLGCLKLRENATSSAGRCFIMFLFQELVSILSLRTLLEYTKEPNKRDAFKDLFPRDEEQDVRFAINFFTCSGLGALADNLRQELSK